MFHLTCRKQSLSHNSKFSQDFNFLLSKHFLSSKSTKMINQSLYCSLYISLWVFWCWHKCRAPSIGSTTAVKIYKELIMARFHTFFIPSRQTDANPTYTKKYWNLLLQIFFFFMLSKEYVFVVRNFLPLYKLKKDEDLTSASYLHILDQCQHLLSQTKWS